MLRYVLIIIASSGGHGGMAIKEVGQFSRDGCEAAAKIVKQADRSVGNVAAFCVYRQ